MKNRSTLGSLTSARLLALGSTLELAACGVGSAPPSLGSHRAALQECCAECYFTGLPPITDLGPGQTYLGEPGGLYPNGSNDMPADHCAAGEAIARSLLPLVADGSVDMANGRIVAIDIGISLTLDVWSGIWWSSSDPNYTDGYFVSRARSDPLKNPKLQLGQTYNTGDVRWDTRDQNNAYYVTANQQLAGQGITPAQVQIVWFYPFPLTAGGADCLVPGVISAPHRNSCTEVSWKQSLRALKQVYPNLRMAYLGSKHHAYVPLGTPGPFDPGQHDVAWSVKWTIEAQIGGAADLNYAPERGPVVAPWIAWGPYFWSDGPTPRTYDGFHFDCQDVSNYLADDGDFTHPGRYGIEKEAAALFDFFRTNPTARPWYFGVDSGTGGSGGGGAGGSCASGGVSGSGGGGSGGVSGSGGAGSGGDNPADGPRNVPAEGGCVLLPGRSADPRALALLLLVCFLVARIGRINCRIHRGRAAGDEGDHPGNVR